MSRLEEKYQKEVTGILQKEFGLDNPMAAPRILKIVINLGIKEAAHDEAVLKKAEDRLSLIFGQKPKICRAKKSIAEFKIAKGNIIGLVVTLRGQRMYNFLDKLFSIVLPRVRDFRGVSRESFDGHGNYTLGIEEQVVFPEVEFDRAEKAKGLEITIVTDAKDDQKAERLLGLLGMPFSAKLADQGKPGKENLGS